MTTARSQAFAPFAAAYADPEGDARAHRATGGKVVGYMSATGPVELIEAAGMFALRLDGRGREQTPRADAFVERLFDPSVRAVCDRLLGGELDVLDAIVLPRTTDSIQRLYYYLCEIGRASGGLLPQVLLFDLLQTPGAPSAAYSRARLEELSSRLEAIAGRGISEADLRDAMALSRRRCDALTGLIAGRRATPPTVTGWQALQLMHAARTMAPERFIAAAGRLAATPPEERERARPRLVVAGNGPDTLDLHAVIEDAGGWVVGDYHETGELGLGGGVEPGSPDPVGALADHYHVRAFSPRRFPFRPHDLVDFAAAAAADAVIFFYYAEEEVLSWEHPAQKRLLDAAGVASLCLGGQPYRVRREAVGPIVRDFLGRLPRRAAGTG